MCSEMRSSVDLEIRTKGTQTTLDVISLVSGVCVCVFARDSGIHWALVWYAPHLHSRQPFPFFSQHLGICLVARSPSERGSHSLAHARDRPLLGIVELYSLCASLIH